MAREAEGYPTAIGGEQRAGSGRSKRCRSFCTRSVALGGKNGPTARLVESERRGRTGSGWYTPEPQVVGHFGNPNNHALLLDPKPDKRGNVSLYRPTDIRDFSYKDWTPACLRLESIFTDRKEENADACEQSSDLDPIDLESDARGVHDFLCLRGGTNQKGPWGRGMTAGASLAIVVLTDLARGHSPTLTDAVLTATTPGESVDVMVTGHGVAVNPRRGDLLDLLSRTGLPLKDMAELKTMADEAAGTPQRAETDDGIVAVVEYRDGTVLDVVRRVVG